MSHIYAGDKIYIETMKDFLVMAKEEINKAKKEFDKERKDIYYRQAGEKCYNAIWQLAFLLNKNEFTKHDDLDRFYENTRRINKSTAYALMNTGRALHENFYHGHIAKERIENAVNYMSDLINAILKDLEVGII